MIQQNFSAKHSVTSQHFINSLHALVIQLTQAFAVEHQIKPDPDAKSMTRNILQNIANVLLSDQELKELKEAIKVIGWKPERGSTHAGGAPLTRELNVILRIMGLDDIESLERIKNNN